MATLARYSFVSWLRRGVGTQIARRDGDAGNTPRAVVNVHVGFNNDTLGVDVPLELYGSGELASLDAFTVVRTWPRPDAPDAEPNYFPLVEVREADALWRLTAAAPAANGRLRPWLVLAVLRDDEATWRPATAQGGLPSMVVKSTTSLPDLSQSWAWAHVQMDGPAAEEATLRQALAAGDGRVRARLLCPRRLDARTRYTACLVPAFERGRLRGLQLPVGPVDGLAPAWTLGQAGVTLPIHHRWSFHTEAEGDFESLVRRLVPRMLPPEVGVRDMDVSNPRGALHGIAAHGGPLGLEGALKTVRTQSTPWPASPTKQLFTDRLTTLLNLPAERLAGQSPERVVAPPLYGARHAARDKLQPGTPPQWFQELNHDPRLRTTSGLGTQVVQAQQRELMAGAWLQVEGVRAKNEARRQAQLARSVSVIAHTRHVVTAADEDLLLLTRNLHTRVKGSPVTIAALLRDSPIPSGVLDTAWRRFARPLGPAGRRQGRPAAARAAATLLQRLNAGTLRPGAAPPTPATLPTLGGAASAAVPRATGSGASPGLRLTLWLLILLCLLLAFAAFGILGGIALAVVAGVAWTQLPAAWRTALRNLLLGGQAPQPDEAGQVAAQALVEERFDPTLVEAVSATTAFSLQDAPPLGTPLPAAAGTTADNTEALAFRGALSQLFGDLGAALPVQRPLTPVDLPLLRTKLQTAIDPRITIAQAFTRRTHLAIDLGYVSPDPLDDLKAYPEFPQPMYEALRELGQDWLLPGMELIPGNTIALLITNQRTVEAYMAGLNHEMGRELLWNEYPTELRGTFFRQFWDVRGVPPPPSDPEGLLDIEKMHQWKPHAALGANSARAPMPGGEERLVLLVRGDLFRRYPNTHVYAVEAAASPDRKRQLTDRVVDYEFHGKLSPDIVFFGFPLTPTQAKGATTDPTDVNKHQGYFFVLQEQAAEPRFGLDADGTFDAAVNSFDQLGWPHLSASAADQSSWTHIDLNRTLPKLGALDTGDQPAWHADSGTGRHGSQASHLAEITLQKPVLIAIHGSDMLRDT
ncbi:hypothetical protein QTH90_30180 [Variovorax sp. J2P1-59]|uniref:hypothetical protein n=1 Tax=Variovorax flavidus TaxID=3053501 RepID=UPI0025770797|nr:hypothetical protein [Variovorax sp. J2P1-59]MDM0078710.1 hypothetical protein [Variovorax sp. J2P1-59]